MVLAKLREAKPARPRSQIRKAERIPVRLAAERRSERLIDHLTSAERRQRQNEILSPAKRRIGEPVHFCGPAGLPGEMSESSTQVCNEKSCSCATAAFAEARQPQSKEQANYHTGPDSPYDRAPLREAEPANPADPKELESKAARQEARLRAQNRIGKAERIPRIVAAGR